MLWTRSVSSWRCDASSRTYPTERAVEPKSTMLWDSWRRPLRLTAVAPTEPATYRASVAASAFLNFAA